MTMKVEQLIEILRKLERDTEALRDGAGGFILASPGHQPGLAGDILGIDLMWHTPIKIDFTL